MIFRSEDTINRSGTSIYVNIIKKYMRLFENKKINPTAYHPQCNRLTERFNATLCQIISMFIKNNQTDWHEFYKTALFAYNTSKQETILMSPFEVLNDREPVI